MPPSGLIGSEESRHGFDCVARHASLAHAHWYFACQKVMSARKTGTTAGDPASGGLQARHGSRIVTAPASMSAMPDMRPPLSDCRQVPGTMASRHTAKVSGHAVEGHAPADADIAEHVVPVNADITMEVASIDK